MNSTVTFDISDITLSVHIAVTVFHDPQLSDTQVSALASKLLRFRLADFESHENQLHWAKAISIERHEHVDVN